MDNCLNCQKEITQKEGKRAKKFCNDICRATYWQKKNKGKEPKYVLFKTFKEMQEKLNKAMAEANLAGNATQNELKYSDESHRKAKEIVINNFTTQQPKTNFTINTAEKSYSQYNFVNEQWLILDKYTKYPKNQKPIFWKDQKEWMKAKQNSDQEIIIAWHEFKKDINEKETSKAL